jgi:hypothetical protein
MPFAVEENEALDPATVSQFGADGIMFDPHDFGDLVEEAGFGIGDNVAGGKCSLCRFNIPMHEDVNCC